MISSGDGFQICRKSLEKDILALFFGHYALLEAALELKLYGMPKNTCIIMYKPIWTARDAKKDTKCVKLFKIENIVTFHILYTTSHDVHVYTTTTVSSFYLPSPSNTICTLLASLAAHRFL